MTPLASGTKLQPVEFLEREYPVIIEGYGLRPNSEGAGMHRGGFGLNFPIRLTDGDGILSVQGDREKLRPWGYDGGQSPEGTGMYYVSPEGERENVGIMRAGFRVAAGGLLEYWQGGGGGWGHPFDRPSEWVVEDVRNGLVSVERAREAYGVAIEVRDAEAAEYVLDESETAALRADRSEAEGN